MNERLQQEIEKYITEKHLKSEAFLVSSIAEHFYNLALGDMKAKLKVVADHYNNDLRYDGGCALDELYDFIEQLSK